MRRRIIQVLLVAAIVGSAIAAQFCGLCAHASTSECTRSHVLGPGAPAPCAGLLVPEEEAARAALCIAVDLPDCRRRRKHEAEEARIRREAAESLLRIENKLRKECDAALDECARIVTDTPGPEPASAWWSRAEVWGLTAGGVVLGVGVTLLAVWAAGAL